MIVTTKKSDERYVVFGDSDEQRKYLDKAREIVKVMHDGTIKDGRLDRKFNAYVGVILNMVNG